MFSDWLTIYQRLDRRHRIEMYRLIRQRTRCHRRRISWQSYLLSLSMFARKH